MNTSSERHFEALTKKHGLTTEEYGIADQIMSASSPSDNGGEYERLKQAIIDGSHNNDVRRDLFQLLHLRTLEGRR